MAFYECSMKTSGDKIVKQLVGTLIGNGTIDVKEQISNYADLTSEDFIMELTALQGQGDVAGTVSGTSTLTYDSTTGIITCRGVTVRASGNWTGAVATVNVYYLYVE